MRRRSENPQALILRRREAASKDDPERSGLSIDPSRLPRTGSRAATRNEGSSHQKYRRISQWHSVIAFFFFLGTLHPQSVLAADKQRLSRSGFEPAEVERAAFPFFDSRRVIEQRFVCAPPQCSSPVEIAYGHLPTHPGEVERTARVLTLGSFSERKVLTELQAVDLARTDEMKITGFFNRSTPKLASTAMEGIARTNLGNWRPFVGLTLYEHGEAVTVTVAAKDRANVRRYTSLALRAR